MPIFFTQRGRCNRREPKIVIRLCEAIVRDLICSQLRAHAVKRGNVWDANQYDVGNALSLRVGSRYTAGGVIRLHHLVLNGKVLPDEQVGVAVVDLCHDVLEFTPLAVSCQVKSLVRAGRFELPRVSPLLVSRTSVYANATLPAH